MKKVCLNKNLYKVLIGCLILLIVGVTLFGVNFVVNNKLSTLFLQDTKSRVDSEELSKDIDIILNGYGLQKKTSGIICEEGNAEYDLYYKTEQSRGKSLFINAYPIFVASSKKYTEIEALMEIWLYTETHKLDFEVDGITLYFTAPDEIFDMLSPIEIYTTKQEFQSLYSTIENDDLSYRQKIKKLADEYIRKNAYKRKEGHMQVK